MNGNQILTEVRFIIDDMGYSRYNEINRAYREIGRITRHNWLRGESEEILEFLDGVSTYWIDLADKRVFQALYVKGNDSGKKKWFLTEEVSKKLFEEKRDEHISPDGTDRESRPAWYKILEVVNNRINIQVTPVPDETYSTRIEYIKSLENIGPATIPSMSPDYHDLIANLASGMVLERDKDPKERIRGAELKANAMKDAILGMTRDAHANRTKDITRPRRSVNEFI